MRPPKVNRYSQVILLSSPVHFVGHLDSEHFDLSLAWPLGNRGVEHNPESPFYNSFFALSFLTKERPQDRENFVMLPDFSIVGDYFCCFLSLIFGKRFQNLGFYESNGIRRVPDVGSSRSCRMRTLLPFSSKPRKDLGIDLNLSAVLPALKLFDSVFLELDENRSVPAELNLAFTAARFYVQALDLFEDDPELSYISLVNAGEVLASGLAFTGKELFDPEMRRLLCKIAQCIGAADARALRARLYQVRRKFRLGLAQLVSPALFEGHESVDAWAAMKPESFHLVLNAAYDLRSRFLHTGARFAPWARFHQSRNAEIQLGEPSGGEADWKRVVSRMPTLVGLERIIRFSILKFIHNRVTFLNDALSQASPVAPQ